MIKPGQLYKYNNDLIILNSYCYCDLVKVNKKLIGIGDIVMIVGICNECRNIQFLYENSILWINSKVFQYYFEEIKL